MLYLKLVLKPKGRVLCPCCCQHLDVKNWLGVKPIMLGKFMESLNWNKQTTYQEIRKSGKNSRGQTNLSLRYYITYLTRAFFLHFPFLLKKNWKNISIQFLSELAVLKMIPPGISESQWPGSTKNDSSRYFWVAHTVSFVTIHTLDSAKSVNAYQPGET